MPVLVTGAAVLLVGLVLLNLLLTVGVIRRLKEHTELIDTLRASGPPDRIMLPPGAEVGDFSAEALDGTAVSRDGLDGETLVGVFSPGCPACADQLPKFVDLAESFPGGRDRVLAVVVGDPRESADETARLAPAARVVNESHEGAVSKALGVSGFPAMARVGADGRVLASGYRIDDLEAAAGV
jgi:peroxiredoxin